MHMLRKVSIVLRRIKEALRKSHVLLINTKGRQNQYSTLSTLLLGHYLKWITQSALIRLDGQGLQPSGEPKRR